MAIYLRVTDNALIDAVSAIRTTPQLETDKTLLELCPAAHSVYFENGEALGLLFDHTKAKCALVDEGMTGFRLVRADVPRFGRMCSLYEPDRRTTTGRRAAVILDALQHTARVARYVVDLVGPRIKSTLQIDEFGFDYRSQARVSFVSDRMYIAIVGVTVLNRVFDTGHGVELIDRNEYRVAVKQVQTSARNLLFSESDSLVLRAQQALAPFMPLEVRVVNSLLTDIWQRVITKPEEIGHYINHLLLPRELTFIFTTLVGILHAFYGIE